MENKNRVNNSSNGFWLGLVLGVVLTLLFTTKKGRAILNVLLDKGMQKISDLEERIKDSDYMDDVDENGDYIKREPIQEVRYIAEKEDVVEEQAKVKPVRDEAIEEEQEEDHKTKPASNGHASNGSASHLASAKRFFKKAPKRS